MKHTLNEQNKKAGVVELFSGNTGDGKEFYAYLSVFPTKYVEYVERQECGKTTNMHEYGSILKTGWRKTSSKEAQQERTIDDLSRLHYERVND